MLRHLISMTYFYGNYLEKCPVPNIQTMSKEPPVMGPNTGPICHHRQILKRKIAASRQTLFIQNNHVTIATVYITMMTIIHRKFFPSHEI